jgi:hypothetical protein
MTFLRGSWSQRDVAAVLWALSGLSDPMAAVMVCDVRTVDLGTGR